MAAVLPVHNTTLYRALARFRASGEAGLAEGRADNGADEVDDRYGLPQSLLVRDSRPLADPPGDEKG
jgi:hypothetical protein